VNPSVLLLAGISTHPPAGAARLQTLTQAAEAAAKRVDGLWVNVFSDHPAQRRVGGLFFRWLQLYRH
jgi:hypothetical protein